MTKPISKTITVKLQNDGVMSAIPVRFDPKAVFGKVRAPVKVTINRYSYRSTIFSMHGATFIPLRKSNREAAGLAGDETVKVTIALDTAVREVVVPPDLASALRKNRSAAVKWSALSYSHRREHAEAILGAKKPETRARRLANTLRALEGISSASKRR
ncbi:MAG: YdeI/OmpD-associated family protein [Pseudomonadota bacterium]